MEHDDTRTSDSTDAKVTQELIETLVDGRDGFDQAADHLASDNATVAGRFRELSNQRETMAADLRTMAARYGDTVDSDGTTAAGLHRRWIGMKDALTGNNVNGVVKAAITGEDHAINEYEKALKEDISADLRTKVQDQLSSIRSVKAELESITN